MKMIQSIVSIIILTASSAFAGSIDTIKIKGEFGEGNVSVLQRALKECESLGGTIHTEGRYSNRAVQIDTVRKQIGESQYEYQYTVSFKCGHD